MDRKPRVAILWHGDRESRDSATRENNRFSPVFKEFEKYDFISEPAVYHDAFVDEVRQQLLETETGALPIIWDADFLYGPKTATGEETYVLCEINVSSVYPYPESAPSYFVKNTVERILNQSHP